MSIDKAIQDAIHEAVGEHGQLPPLADKLVRWFGEVVSGNESLDDEEAVYRRLDILFETVEVAQPEEDAE